MGSSRGYTIGAILLLTIVVATVLASLRPVFDGRDVFSVEPSGGHFIAHALAMVAAIVIGVLVGLSQRWPVVGVIVGFLAAQVTCVMALFMSLCRESAMTLVVGAAVLLVVALSLRAASQDDV